MFPRILALTLTITAGAGTPLLAGPPQDLPNVLRGADRVVVGDVVATQAYKTRNQWGDQLIVTRATVRAQETLKGTPVGSLAVDVEGGTLDGITLSVSSLPTIKPGERGVFMLHRKPDGAFSLQARGAGLLKLNPDDTVQGTNLTLSQVRSLAAAAR